MKVDPNWAVALDQLHDLYEKLLAEFVARNQDVSIFLYPIVTEILKLPRGTKMKYSEIETCNSLFPIYRKEHQQIQDDNLSILTPYEPRTILANRRACPEQKA